MADNAIIGNDEQLKQFNFALYPSIIKEISRACVDLDIKKQDFGQIVVAEFFSKPIEEQRRIVSEFKKRT